VVEIEEFENELDRLPEEVRESSFNVQQIREELAEHQERLYGALAAFKNVVGRLSTQ